MYPCIVDETKWGGGVLYCCYLSNNKFIFYSLIKAFFGGFFTKLSQIEEEATLEKSLFEDWFF